MTQVAEAGTPKRAPLALQALFMPDQGMQRAARLGRVRWPLLFAVFCSVLFAVAQAARVDARTVTLQQLEQSGRLQQMSDRQIEDESKGAERKFMVKKLAWGAVEAPGELLFSAVGLFALAWFLRGRSKSNEIFTVSAFALLPGAIANLLDAVAAFLSPSISPEGAKGVPRTLAALVALAGKELTPMSAAFKLLSAVDVFALWGAVMLAFGLIAAADLPPRRALVGALVAWICYRLVRTVALGA